MINQNLLSMFSWPIRSPAKEKAHFLWPIETFSSFAAFAQKLLAAQTLFACCSADGSLDYTGGIFSVSLPDHHLQAFYKLPQKNPRILVGSRPLIATNREQRMGSCFLIGWFIKFKKFSVGRKKYINNERYNCIKTVRWTIQNKL